MYAKHTPFTSYTSHITVYSMAHRKIFAGIFLLSFSSLSYEIALTRVFSISLWYHFAFMVISIAMLGIGASGTILSLYPKLKAPSRIGVYGLFLGAGIILSYILSNQIPFDPIRLSWDKMQIFYICLYYLLLSIPFFFFGLSVSTAFSAISEKSGLIYGSDLFGAGIGSISVLYFMSIMSPENSIILISSTALAGVFIIGSRKIKIISVFLIILNAVILIISPSLINPRMSQYKGLQSALRYPGAEHIKTYNSPFSRIDVFKSPAVRFAPGLSLKYLEDIPEQTGISIDGGDINAVTNTEDKEKLRFLKYLPSALPYEIGKRDDVLILEPKGGLDVLSAQYYGSKNIYKVDSNPLAIKVIRDNVQGVYDKDTWDGFGRSWLKTRDNKFDIIDIPLMGASPAGSFGITEDYRFTVEAFKEYLGHLKDNGILSIHLFILPPPRTELRLLNTLIASMEEMGIKETDKNIISIRTWGTIIMLAKITPFTMEEIETVRKFSIEKRFDLIHIPGIKEQEANIYVKMPSNEYFKAFSALLNPETRKSFQQNYIFDIKPVWDENPFFHYYLKIKNIKTIYNIMGGKWQYFIEEGYLLPAVFMQVLLISIVLMSLPAFSRKRMNSIREDEAKKRRLFYFAFLGIGFMFVEISLIQKMILPLENPSYAVAVVLTSILIGSGIGSLLSYRFSIMRSQFILLALSFLIICYSLLIQPISNIIMPYPMPLKIILVFAIFIPLSILMGIPFPIGIKNLGEKTPDIIPWALAINGCLSVLSPILTVMLAMMFGFKTVLWIGAGAYLFAFFTFLKSKRLL